MPVFLPLGRERVALPDGLGRVLAAPVRTRFDLPPMSNSAMDGYAVRTKDLEAAPAEFSVAFTVRAGSVPEPLPPGAVARIFTGATLPPGADAVLEQEATEALAEGLVRLLELPVAGRHVRAQASDAATGAVLLEAGTKLGPGELGLAAGCGVAVVTVARRPRVAILGTGDELRDLGEPARPGSVVDTNAYTLAAQVLEAGGLPEILPVVPDRLDAAEQALREAASADLILTSGGVSVGEADVMKSAFAAVGVDVGFWKVWMKPGKPLCFGRLGTTPVVGLPGNPVSAMVGFELFVRPGIRRMLGDDRPFRLEHEVSLETEHRRRAGRPELARARITSERGRLWARLGAQQGSGSLPSLGGADALVLLPEKETVLDVGARLPAILLRDGTGSERAPFAGRTGRA